MRSSRRFGVRSQARRLIHGDRQQAGSVNGTDVPTVVCFDLGGVIVRICRSWAEACDLANLPVRDLDSEQMVGRRARWQALVDDYQRGTVSGDDYFEGFSGTLNQAEASGCASLIAGLPTGAISGAAFDRVHRCPEATGATLRGTVRETLAEHFNALL
jgi:hypothetical protein